MSKIHVIADGGGTSTNWCIITDGQRKFLVTESYHPVNWSTQFKERAKTFWIDQLDISSVKLSFFGAGCFQSEIRAEARKLFADIGFGEISVSSDLHGAALASLGSSSGWMGIAGTGSVVFEWNGSEVGSLIGGKGFELGDEGSAYFFGKLIVAAHQNNEMSSKQKDVFGKIFSKTDLALQGEKLYYASLAEKLSDDHSLFLAYHEQNIRAFFQSHLGDSTIRRISLVGGYAWHLKDEFERISSEYGIKITSFLSEPIRSLVERMVGSSE